MRAERQVAVALGRRFGTTPEATERIREENAGLQWHALCPRCRCALKGTPAQLAKHKCEDSDG